MDGRAASLAGRRVHAAGWPAATAAGELLAALGADVEPAQTNGPALACGDVHVDCAPTSAAEDWQRSGVAELTGRRDGPALVPRGAPATLAHAAGLAVELVAGLAGRRLQLDGAAMLGLRAQATPLARQGDVSVGDTSRLLPTTDGWWCLALARHADRELVPALVEQDVDVDDAWPAITAWSAARPGAQVLDRALLLAMPASILSETPAPESPWQLESTPAHARPQMRRPLVVNLGALWAGPLAAHMLYRGGAEVVDVESRGRPDGVRLHHPAFYHRLHDGHRLITLDFAAREDLASLAALLHDADVVIEASRPRALRELGLDAATVNADGRARTWIRITGHGPDQPHRVGFGDDAAVAGGLVAVDDAGPVFAGDAIADPLTGLLAALAALAALSASSEVGRRAASVVIDLSLARSAAWARRT